MPRSYTPAPTPSDGEKTDKRNFPGHLGTGLTRDSPDATSFPAANDRICAYTLNGCWQAADCLIITGGYWMGRCGFDYSSSPVVWPHTPPIATPGAPGFETTQASEASRYKSTNGTLDGSRSPTDRAGRIEHLSPLPGFSQDFVEREVAMTATPDRQFRYRFVPDTGRGWIIAPDMVSKTTCGTALPRTVWLSSPAAYIMQNATATITPPRPPPG